MMMHFDKWCTTKTTTVFFLGGLLLVFSRFRLNERAVDENILRRRYRRLHFFTK